jgi:hypothetical protein
LIQVALTPIFLISAIGVTLNVLTNRLARIVDRARSMEDQLRSGNITRTAGSFMGSSACWRAAPVGSTPRLP